MSPLFTSRSSVAEHNCVRLGLRTIPRTRSISPASRQSFTKRSVAFTYWTFTYVAGNIKFASYLQIPYIANVGEVAIFCASVIAASLGFLWFNAYPASMMMGDVGALALGGALGTVAVLAKQELALMIAGGVFVAEAASTIIQRYYFKATHKRFFLIGPRSEEC